MAYLLLPGWSMKLSIIILDQAIWNDLLTKISFGLVDTIQLSSDYVLYFLCHQKKDDWGNMKIKKNSCWNERVEKNICTIALHLPSPFLSLHFLAFVFVLSKFAN